MIHCYSATYAHQTNMYCYGMCCDDINLCISFISCILAEPTPLLSDAKIHTLKTIQRMNNLLLYSAKDLYRPYTISSILPHTVDCCLDYHK